MPSSPLEVPRHERAPSARRARLLVAPMSTSAPAPVFSYVGGASAAQTVVTDSPFFGRVPRPEQEKTAIAILKYASGGPVLSGMHPMSAHVGWLARHPTNGHLYAASAGRLISLRIAQDGSLRETSSANALGNPAHFELSSDGAWVLVANYAESNVVVLPILPDGTVGDAVDSKHHALPAPNPALRERQESSHPHQVRLDPRGEKWALVPDLGADRVWVYGFDASRGSLLGASNSKRHLELPEGAGPRHLDFHPNGRWVYVLCELDGKIVCCSWDGLSGTLTPFQSVSTLPDRVEPCRAHHSGSAHIRVSRNGRAVYATTRTDGSAVVLQVSPTGELTVSQSVTSGGICPRHFVLDYAPAGDAWLRIANQDSQTIVSYLLGKNGEMTAPGDGLWQTVWASPATLELDGLCPSVITPPAPPPIWQLSEAGPTAAVPATGVIRSSFEHMFGALA